LITKKSIRDSNPAGTFSLRKITLLWYYVPGKKLMVQIALIEFPKPWFAFWAAIALSLGYIAFAFFRKWRTWSRGIPQPSSEPDDYRRSAMIWLTDIFFQRQLFALSVSRWLVHILIFYGFTGLILLSFIVQILGAAGYLDISSTVPRFYLHPEGHLFIKLWGDGFGLMLLLGLVLAYGGLCCGRSGKRATRRIWFSWDFFSWLPFQGSPSKAYVLPSCPMRLRVFPSSGISLLLLVRIRWNSFNHGLLPAGPFTS
jgi:hypothetical protein